MPAFHRQAFPARSEAAPHKTMTCEAEDLPQTRHEQLSASFWVWETTKKSSESEIAKTIILTCDVARSLPDPFCGCCSGDYKLPLIRSMIADDDMKFMSRVDIECLASTRGTAADACTSMP